MFSLPFVWLYIHLLNGGKIEKSRAKEIVYGLSIWTSISLILIITFGIAVGVITLFLKIFG